MKYTIILFSLLLSFSSISSHLYPQSFFEDGPLNTLNPNFNYPNQTLVNTSAINIPFPGQMYTGYLTANETSQAKIFYILYSAGGLASNTSINNSAPLILWMQGGPGCSDSLGNFQEIGPITVIYDENGNAIPAAQNITWGDEYNLLFVDQPVGVGYSVDNGDNIITATRAAIYMQNFLVNFFDLYPFLLDNDFYIFGESYAGHYIPALTSYLIENSAQTGIQLTAIGIGDGWTDPYFQVATYSEYSYAAGIIDQFNLSQIEGWEQQAQLNIVTTQYSTGSGLFDLITGTITNFTNIDIYNYREYTNLSAPGEALDVWLGQANVITQLGVDPSVSFQDCNNPMYYAFYNDITQSYVSNVTYILTNPINPIPILLYNGQDDIIVNTPGSLGWINEMDWYGNTGFRTAPRNIWYDANGTVLGAVKQYQNLTFVVVNKAGHMVPGDQPASARDMLNRFIYNNWN